MATSSIRGSLLQLVNLGIGILIYKPFVVMYDAERLKQGYKNLKELIELLQEKEKNNTAVVLTEQNGDTGMIARMLAEDFRQTLEAKAFHMYYQPQHNNKGDCIGAEALLRWKHPVFGIIYPPLVIKLVEELGLLQELEITIFKKVAEDMEGLDAEALENCKISVNVSAQTIQKAEFMEFLQEFARVNQNRISFCIEITEQMALTLDENLQDTFSLLHRLGFLLAIDDFSMGATSLKYLQKNQFDLVKLDGNLIKEIETNERSKNIVASIVYLSSSLGFDVIAEFVETEREKEVLEEIGCVQYQGYLYSPAIPIEEFKMYKKYKIKQNE